MKDIFTNLIELELLEILASLKKNITIFYIYIRF